MQKTAYQIIRLLELRRVLFLFQAEDGIRDYKVTGVQTCALLISSRRRHTRLQGDWSSDVCSSDLTRRSTSSIVCGAGRRVARTVAISNSTRGWGDSRISVSASRKARTM